MRSFRRTVMLCVVGAIVLAALLSSASALAAPSFGVQIERDEAVVSRSDERVDYTVTVKNVGSAVAQEGDRLTCLDVAPGSSPGFWRPVPVTGLAPTLTYEWRRNGARILGANSRTYIATGDDVGKTIQCLVTGTNSVARAVYVSLPATVVTPPPSVAPPAPINPLVNDSRPAVAGTNLEKRTCAPPANWGGSPTYAFQWLRNAEPIAGAEAAEYTPVAATDEGKVLQCEVIGSNSGGAIVGISNSSPVGSLNEIEVPYTAAPATPATTANATSGMVTVEVELPAGEGTYASEFVNPSAEGAAPVGWSCEAVPGRGGRPAKAICTRSDPLFPGSSYPPIKIFAALGFDAPELAAAKATAFGGGAAAASVEDSFSFVPPIPFGIASFSTVVADAAGNDYVQAGGHPVLAGTSFSFTTKRRLRLVDNTPQKKAIEKYALIEHPKSVDVDTPRGFVGNPTAIPQLCSSAVDLSSTAKACPAASLVGKTDVLDTRDGFISNLPVFAIEPEFGLPAQFAFLIPGGRVYTFAPHLRADDGYAISIDSAPVGENPEVLKASVSLCSFGAKATAGLGEFRGCREAGEPGAYSAPLITNPTRCGAQGPVTKLSIDSWEHPGDFTSAEFESPKLEGCDKVPFEPQIHLQPTSQQADSPTGLDVSLTMPTTGLEEPEGIAQANLDTARVTFPMGMSVNPSLSSGLGACTPGQIKLGTNDPIECPESSKIGTAEVKTPLLADPLKGNIYVAQQNQNPFSSLLALYLVVESKKDGILIKIPGKVTPDSVTGQLVSSFAENPQAPFSSLALHFNDGPRAPLINPPTCGSYGITAQLSPWTAADPANPTPAETINQTSNFQVATGPNGGPCPNGSLDPKLDAGVSNPKAGSTSPFFMRLSREDGSQRFSGLDLTMPPGLTAYLKDIPYCPDNVLAGISDAEEAGRPQIANPSCPAASQLGTAVAGAGAGPNPFYADTGKVYLAGPYKGAPLSLAIVTPAVAGPFDLGNIVVRAGAYVNSETAQITVKSDRIPTILHGILLDVRDIRVNVDRSGFTLNPTNCEPMSIDAQVQGEKGGNASVSNRFQVGECAALGFKPNMTLRLKGGTTRGKNPALTARVTYPKGAYANIKRVSVALPHSEFLDQSHIRTVCTRVQFAASACPKGSIYGRAEATSPLLGYKLTGPVYLRSSSHKLPDLVVALRGPAWQPLEIDLAGRIDSVRGGIRNRFEMVPDAPVSNFVLKMQGGKKGLLVNSRNICRSKSRATVKLDGQNGAVHDFRPVLHSANCKKAKKKKASRHGKKGAAARHRRG